MSDPWVVAGKDVSLGLVAGIKLALSLDEAQKDLESRPRRPPVGGSPWTLRRGKVPGAVGPVKAYEAATGRPVRLWFDLWRRWRR